ncbi:MAG: HD domain-containing protein [Nitrospiraceae bacterium]|nr:MAG: HD domain-containing protein [Nitrospiraceae bacterium]
MISLKPDPGTRSDLEEYIKTHQEMIDVLPHPFFITDTDFNIAFCSSSMKRFMGDVDNLKNAKCYQLFHQSAGPSATCPLINQTKNGNAGAAEAYLPSLKKHLLIYASPLVLRDRLIGALHSVTDVTGIKESEKEHRELVDIYSQVINEMKIRELKAKTGREAFFNMLEDITESYKDLEELFLKLVRVMVNSLDAKSPWTKGHSVRVSLYAEQIALEMLIDGDEIKDIRLAGLLHDIGKIGTSDYLLDKPGRLSPEEFEIVKKHPAQGAAILEEIKQLNNIIPLVKYHHEKIDGTGYPYKLRGDNIPLGAKILHVADSYDSMTSDRPYRASPGVEYALAELHRYRGTQFDSEVVDAFLRVLEKREKPLTAPIRP